jgi:hypothetical protein
MLITSSLHGAEILSDRKDALARLSAKPKVTARASEESGKEALNVISRIYMLRKKREYFQDSHNFMHMSI